MSNIMDRERMNAFAQLTLLRNAIANVAPEDPELKVIDSLLDKLHSRPYALAVVGEFNRGKSSLINALLGMNVLPADITPTTATINRVVYSDIPYAHLHMRDGRVEEIPLAMLKGRVTKLSEEAQSAAAQVEEAVIGYPTVFCKNNIAILDTPGLNESEDMDALTVERCQEADALIYTIHALIPFSISEAEAVCRLLEYSRVRHVLFTVGFMDQVPPEEHERMLTLIRKRILKLTSRILDEDTLLEPEEVQRRKDILAGAEVLGVSAKAALDAFVNGSMEQLQLSGIEHYKKELMARLTAQQDEWVAHEIRPYVEKTTAIFNDVVERNLSAMDLRITDARKHLDDARQLIGNIPASAGALGERWKQNVLEALGSEEECAQKLRAIMQESIPDLPAAEPTPAPQSASGIFGWIKGKAKEAGLYRDSDDPRIQGAARGFEKAKEILVQEWVPSINSASEGYYAELLANLNQLAVGLLTHLRQARDVLEENIVTIPEELTAANTPRYCLLYDTLLQDLTAMKSGPLNLGPLDVTIQLLSKALAHKLYALCATRMDEVEAGVLLLAGTMQKEAQGVLAPLSNAMDKLRRKRDELHGQINSVRRFLLGQKEAAVPEAEQPVPGENPSTPVDDQSTQA